MMLKLYRTSASSTEYWEAWNTATEITIHWGKLGETGETRELAIEPGFHPSELIKRNQNLFEPLGSKRLRNPGKMHHYPIQD